MFRNIDQRNNLVLLLTSVLLIIIIIIIIIVKEVHQSLNETMRLFDESVEEHFLSSSYLLTFS